MRTTLSFLLLIVLSQHSPAQCLLPAEGDFTAFRAELLQRDDWAQKAERASTRLETYAYTEEIDSLLHFARGYLRVRLPDSLICRHVDVNDSSWLYFSRHNITMNFSYYYDSTRISSRDDKIRLAFTYDLESGKITTRKLERQFWIPDCLAYPDSCDFKVRSDKEAIEIAEKVGFADDDYRPYYAGHSDIPSFHFQVAKQIDDDCGVQSLYVNAYSGDTLLGPPTRTDYSRDRCRTWAEKLADAELVVDATVIHRNSFAVSGNIYTMAELEVHHLFKGELSERVRVVVNGGSLFNWSSSSSHGQQDPGHEKGRYLFLLHRKENYQEKLEKIEGSMGFKPWFMTMSAFGFFRPFRNDFHFYKSPEEHFKRIETITGKQRIKMTPPQTWDEEVLKEVMNGGGDIPDRQEGLKLEMLPNYSEELADSMSLRFLLSGTNSYHYLDSFDIKLSYDTLAFGTHLVQNRNLNLITDWNAMREFYSHYEVSSSDLTADTLLMSWKKKPDSGLFELPVSSPRNAHNNLIMVLNFALKDASKPMHLAASFAGDPVGKNWKDNTTYPIHFQYVSPPIKEPFGIYHKIVLDDFFPKQASIGDTVVIRGQHLKGAELLLFGKSLNNQSFYKPVHKHFIISQDEEQIVFVVPPFLQSPWREESWNSGVHIPISGEIYLKKKGLGLVISEEELKIENDFFKP